MSFVALLWMSLSTARLDWQEEIAKSCPSFEVSAGSESWAAERAGGDLRLRRTDREYWRFRGCHQLGFRLELPTCPPNEWRECHQDPFVAVTFTREGQVVTWAQLARVEQRELMAAMEAREPIRDSLAAALWAHRENQRTWSRQSVLTLQRAPRDEPKTFFAAQHMLFLGSKVHSLPAPPGIRLDSVTFWPAEGARLARAEGANAFYGRVLAVSGPRPQLVRATAICTSGRCLLAPVDGHAVALPPPLKGLVTSDHLIDLELGRVLGLPYEPSPEAVAARTVVSGEGRLTIFDFAVMLSSPNSTAPLELDFREAIEWAVAHGDPNTLMKLFSVKPELDSLFSALRRNPEWKEASEGASALVLDQSPASPGEALQGGLLLGTWHGQSLVGLGEEGVWPEAAGAVKELAFVRHVLVGSHPELDLFEETRQRMHDITVCLRDVDCGPYSEVLTEVLAAGRIDEHDRVEACAAEAQVTRHVGRSSLLRVLERLCEPWVRDAQNQSSRTPRQACTQWRSMCDEVN